MLAHNKERRSRQRWPNPRCCSSSNRYSHRTLSKALWMSSLRKSIGVLDLWKCASQSDRATESDRSIPHSFCSFLQSRRWSGHRRWLMNLGTANYLFLLSLVGICPSRVRKGHLQYRWSRIFVSNSVSKTRVNVVLVASTWSYIYTDLRTCD